MATGTTEDRDVELDRLKRLSEAAAEAMASASPRTSGLDANRRFGHWYNRLRNEAARLLPERAGLMPPRVPTGRGTDSGDGPIDARYLEIKVYLVQLGELLTPEPRGNDR